ncbi:glutamine amidotransferase [Fulvimarina endophytica]|uniref:Glutamine amidotransferase n=1 Tax=Fulvimarina endophytica TaxID=2293836 RepID=A0A371X3T6_9HYPH|nr:glutamine amidotransferase family protein [Fulvimarina endophytica]RFC63674.1 glutamine amidotransferase [Fulvimarina endophytica]
MCGIVGLFLKDRSLDTNLGQLLSDMLVTMTDRGPDSAGIAIYGEETAGRSKVTIQSDTPDVTFADFERRLGDLVGKGSSLRIKDTHAVAEVPTGRVADVRAMIDGLDGAVRVMSVGETMEIYKEVGLPKDVVSRFDIRSMSGTHGIGHTRMATESAVTTLGAHPFSTGADQCLVHNGSLSNHNNLRRELKRLGMRFETQNDSEVAAAYLTARMKDGLDLGEALTSALDDLDGFFTFVVGTKTGFGVLRDPIACKPAVMAETDQYVAFGSEFRALVGLPNIDNARVWEPEPSSVYFWDREASASRTLAA